MRESDRGPYEDPALSHAVERVLAESESMPDPARIRTLWAIVAQRAGLDVQVGIAPTHPPRTKDRFKSQPLRQWRWYAITGLIMGVLGIIVGWDGHAHHLTANTPSSMSTYVTGNGERANISLPDGSTVTLNVASRLDVPADYATGSHTIHLLGEALFTVSRHTEVPFTVIAGGIATRVLGTSFVVRHYPTDAEATVMVREGKVVVGSLVVAAGRFLEVAPHGVPRVGTANPAQFAFATGVLYIPKMPLSQAVTELNRWYGVEIRCGDPSLAQVAITGKFVAGSMADLIDDLSLLLNARIVRSGRVLTLFPKEER